MNRNRGIVVGRMKCYMLIALYLIICNFWMFFCRIEIEYPFFVILNLVSVAVGYLLPYAKDTIKTLKMNRTRKTLVVLTALYVSFATVGSMGIMYPVDRRISIGRIVVVFVNFIWNLGMIAVIIHLAYRRKGRTKEIIECGLSVCEYLILGCVIIIPLTIMLVAFNPGICSYDTNLCLSIYAHNLSEMLDNQPFFYVLFLKCIISVVDSTYVIVFIQILMWCAVWLEAFVFLNKRLRVGFKSLLGLSILISINSANLLYVITIWKDIPYTICILLATILIAELISDCEINMWFCCKLIMSLVGIFLFRKNGPVVYLFVLAALVCYQVKNKRVFKNLFGGIVISVGIIWLIECPIYGYYGIKEDKDGIGTMYIGMSQELFAAYEYGNVSEETQNMLNVLANNNLEEYAYNPYWANAAYNLDVKPIYFIKCYIDSFVKNPRIMIKAILLRQDCLWNVFPGENSWVNLVNYFGGWDGTIEWKEYYPARNWTEFSSYIGDIVSYPGKDSTMNIIVWRSGLHIVIMFMIMVSFYVVYGTCMDIYSIFPVLGQAVSLFLSTGWADFRYYWSINVVTLFIIVLFWGRTNIAHSVYEKTKGCVML